VKLLLQATVVIGTARGVQQFQFDHLADGHLARLDKWGKGGIDYGTVQPGQCVGELPAAGIVEELSAGVEGDGLMPANL